MTPDDWDGHERRSTDKRLASAINEVRELRDAAAKLAEAVVVRTGEFEGIIRRVAAMLAVLLVVLVAFSLWQVSRLERNLGEGQTLITCLLLTDPVTRTAQTLIDCQGGVRR